MLGFLLQQCFKHFKFSYNWVERLACLGKLDSLQHSNANKQVEMSTFWWWKSIRQWLKWYVWYPFMFLGLQYINYPVWSWITLWLIWWATLKLQKCFISEWQLFTWAFHPCSIKTFFTSTTIGSGWFINTSSIIVTIICSFEAFIYFWNT